MMRFNNCFELYKRDISLIVLVNNFISLAIIVFVYIANIDNQQDISKIL